MAKAQRQSSRMYGVVSLSTFRPCLTLWSFNLTCKPPIICDRLQDIRGALEESDSCEFSEDQIEVALEMEKDLLDGRVLTPKYSFSLLEY